MSLSRILNDDMPPRLPSQRVQVPQAPSPALTTKSPPHESGVSINSPQPSYASRVSPPYETLPPQHEPRYHNGDRREYGKYSPEPSAYAPSYRAETDSAAGYHAEPPAESTLNRLLSSPAPSTGSAYMERSEGNPPKRRKKNNQETELVSAPPGAKKSSKSRRQPKAHSTPGPHETIMQVDPPAQTAEVRRLASSDLEDCREIWQDLVPEFREQRRKAMEKVEEIFDKRVLQRNKATAQYTTRKYTTKILRIHATPSPTPSQMMHANSNTLPPLSKLHGAESRMSPGHRYQSPEFEHYGNHNDLAGEDDMQPYLRRDQTNDSAHDAAQALEESLLGPPTTPRDKGKGKEIPKRIHDDIDSDASHGPSAPSEMLRASKKRKIEGANGELLSVPSIRLPKGNGPGTREGSVESTSTAAASGTKQPRKKPRKKGTDTLAPETLASLGLKPSGSGPPSVSGDVSPSGSRASSPALLRPDAIIYELDEIPPPLKRAKRVDDATMAKRLRTLESAQRKVWTTIARKEVARVYRYHSAGSSARQAQCRRIANLASTQARRGLTRTTKAQKDVQGKAKRLMREMMVFWKKNEREERDVRKREQKEAVERGKMEEEKREAARQARKLEFLISQTELYSHFVGSKLKTAEVEGENGAMAVPRGAMLGDIDPTALEDINFDDEDTTNIHRHAKHNAQEAIARARQRAEQFDAQTALERKTNQAVALAKAQKHVREDVERPADSSNALIDLDSDELNFQNPTSLSGTLTVQQPKMLMATLKEYQLKGLNWLATLYEQGINGILADEMGLGKTVQSISLIAYLAEHHNIWGPFLVVSPASTLHNWQQELSRFVPGLKAIPYWGNVKDRATLRKFWSKKELTFNKDSPFHVLVTSYQLVTQDQQYFQRIKWQYMILDEAQNIKNSASVRWKTLLGFQCRNRLLLTGTPIQNSMQELWALLHFIMPSLFDSHDEFNEWFSKDIESAAENKGSKLNEHQLRRLHMILKPFMLRRVKRHVQNELPEKIEKDIFVDLSARQRALYKALLANVSVADLLAKAANIGDAESARSLMNLVMQFRKVCNHPELFERADVVAPFSFAKFGRSGPLNREGDVLHLPYSTRSPIEVAIPESMYREGGLLHVPSADSRSPESMGCLQTLMNIWSTDWLQRSLYEEAHSSSFAFLRILDMSPAEAHSVYRKPSILRLLQASQDIASAIENAPFSSDSLFAVHSVANPREIQLHSSFRFLERVGNLPLLDQISSSVWSQSCLSRMALKWYTPPAVAPPATLYCPDRTFTEKQVQLRDAPLESLAFYGLPPSALDVPSAASQYEDKMQGLSPLGLVGLSTTDQLPTSTMQVPEAKRLIYDSAKLARLDLLLQDLKAGDHRVLVYFQMTRMMDLMEEYLIYRQYKYLRLDGSSKLEDRRDMVNDWQTRPDIFVFLLSTRAGGLGINLTAADTVVFYDHDWNPSNDSQAMDRAHRLGQSKQVTVYRLITKGTIDERIIQMARVKKDVQDIVVGNKSLTEIAKPKEIVQLLLNDDLANEFDAKYDMPLATIAGQANGIANGRPEVDLWNEEGDDFFGHSAPTADPTTVGAEVDELQGPLPLVPVGGKTSTRGKRRKAPGDPAPRGRRGGAKNSGGRRGGRKAAVDGHPAHVDGLHDIDI